MSTTSQSTSEREPRRISGLHAIVDALHSSLLRTGGNCTALARQFGAWQVEITEDEEIERWAHQTGALSAQRR